MFINLIYSLKLRLPCSWMNCTQSCHIFLQLCAASDRSLTVISNIKPHEIHFKMFVVEQSPVKSVPQQTGCWPWSLEWST